MNYVGVDLHKRIIVLCVVQLLEGKRKVVRRARLECSDTTGIVTFFRSLERFQMAVEATAAYEWLAELVEPWADRIVLVNPRKMRIIAESRRKTDKLDAQILADFLAADELPEAWRPTPRVRQHRALVRQRDHFRRRISGLKNRVRAVVAHYNADIKGLFSGPGREHLASVPLNPADRFVADQLLAELDYLTRQRNKVQQRLRQFAAAAPLAEREAREVLQSVPGIGVVTVEVLLSEVGDIRRFSSQNEVVRYAGLDPGQRSSAERRRDLGISKEGSRLLRWAMVELAWRLVNKTRRWGSVYEKLKRRVGAKKAIVAVARRVLCVITSIWRSGKRYQMAGEVLCGS